MQRLYLDGLEKEFSHTPGQPDAAEKVVFGGGYRGEMSRLGFNEYNLS